METNKLFPNSYLRINFSKVSTYIIANIRKRTPNLYRLKRAQNDNPVSPFHLTNKTHEILFCDATLTMQIFTWYQYVWNSWTPFTFRLKPNWDQPNYLSETQRGSGRQLASHKSPKRILTIHKKFEIFTPLQILPDSWFTLQLLSELCENMLLQSRSWLCILFSQKNIFHIRRKRYRLVPSARRGHWWHIVLFPESSFR